MFHIQSLILTYFYRYIPQLIQDGRMWLAMSPLYSILENKKRLYFLNDEEYIAYISEKISTDFKINSNGKSLGKPQIKTLLSKSQSYINKIKEMQDKYNIHIDIIEYIYDLSIKCEDLEEMITLINKNFPDINAKFNDDNDIEILGLYDNEFHSFTIDELFLNELGDLWSVYESIKNKDELTYSYKNSEFKSIYLAKLIRLMYEKCSPKTRVRLKGLGEQSAMELWETTMNPDNRRITKVTMDDFEEAGNIIEILMGKKASLRRDFLEENKDKIGELDI